jgi:hypothetical protein
VPEDEDLRIEALRQELMREVDSVKNDIKGLRRMQILILTGLGILIAAFSTIAAILASAADLF